MSSKIWQTEFSCHGVFEQFHSISLFTQRVGAIPISMGEVVPDVLQSCAPMSFCLQLGPVNYYLLS